MILKKFQVGSEEFRRVSKTLQRGFSVVSEDLRYDFQWVSHLIAPSSPESSGRSRNPLKRL